MTTPFTTVATATVLGGDFIPAHDQTFDIAEAIGRHLEEFRKYVAKVREPEQADNAVTELLTAFLREAEKRSS